MPLGICRTPGCRTAAAGERIERYPGPGEYCPACGERLVPLEEAEPTRELVTRDAQTPEPVAPEPLTPAEFERLRASMIGVLFPQARRTRPRWQFGAAALLIAVGIVTGVAATRMRPVASSAVVAGTVCGSSMTAALAADLVRSYAHANPALAAHLDALPPRRCRVRLVVAPRAAADAVVAHDAVVAVVNPANPIGTIAESELRRILAGDETAWHGAGAPAGTIAPIVPAETTDEARVLAAFLGRTKLGATVRRVPSSADVVRTVAGASGRTAIGIVAFSVAAPAKVLSIEGRPIPSAVSIADHAYPLSVDVTVLVDRRDADPAVRGVAEFARSDAAQSAVVHQGLIARKGS